MCASPRRSAPTATARQSADGFRLLVEQAPNAILRVDTDRRVAYANPAAERLLGADPGAWLGRTCAEVADTHPVALPWDEAVGAVLGGAADAGAESGTESGTEAAPEGRTFLWRMVPERDSAGSTAAVLLYGEEVTETRRMRARLSREAERDPLSGVSTRAGFLRKLEAACAEQADSDARGFAVLFVDLDRFKWVNDRFGHAAGDEVLRVVGRRLLSCVRPTDVVGRLGGDEFAVLLRGAEHQAHAVGAVQRIQRHLAEPVGIGGLQTQVTASVGLSLVSDARTPADVLAGADRAMYHAKRMGPGEYGVQDAAAVVHEAAVLGLERDLERAIGAGELVVHYQPIASLADGRRVGLEALVRWNHPRRGLIGPQAFLPIAEQSRMIVDVDRWVLRTVVEQVRRWGAEGGPGAGVPVSVNVSASHAASPDLADVLRDLVATAGIDPALLMIEVTETALMEATDTNTSTLNRVRAGGVRVCLDDFGTGYSSLHYLRQFTFDVLKMDRSFVHRMPKASADAAIVRSVVGLACSLGLTVVAEGIETPRQLEMLIDMNCEYGQGFLFGRPVPAADVAWQNGVPAPLS
jgi:diguanylate cyclase (GGDEF)-like protein/PAS domain S-box-containing protein